MNNVGCRKCSWIGSADEILTGDSVKKTDDGEIFEMKCPKCGAQKSIYLSDQKSKEQIDT